MVGPAERRATRGAPAAESSSRCEVSLSNSEPNLQWIFAQAYAPKQERTSLVVERPSPQIYRMWMLMHWLDAHRTSVDFGSASWSEVSAAHIQTLIHPVARSTVLRIERCLSHSSVGLDKRVRKCDWIRMTYRRVGPCLALFE